MTLKAAHLPAGTERNSGVRGLVYRGNTIIQHVDNSIAVNFSNNLASAKFEVEFDETNTIDYCGSGNPEGPARGYGLRLKGISGGNVSPTVLQAPIGIYCADTHGKVCLSPSIKASQVGIYFQDSSRNQGLEVKSARIEASRQAVVVRTPPRDGAGIGAFDCIENRPDDAVSLSFRPVPSGAGGSGLKLLLHVIDGCLNQVDLEEGGCNYLGGRDGRVAVDIPDGSEFGLSSARGRNAPPGGGGIVEGVVQGGTFRHVRLVSNGDGYLGGFSGSFHAALESGREWNAIVAEAGNWLIPLEARKKPKQSNQVGHAEVVVQGGEKEVASQFGTSPGRHRKQAVSLRSLKWTSRHAPPKWGSDGQDIAIEAAGPVVVARAATPAPAVRSGKAGILAWARGWFGAR
jgi:hypothetical protein